MFITHEYAVVTLGILVKLPVLDAVVDDLRVNAAAPQICKNTPVVGVFGWQGKFSFYRRCSPLRRGRYTWQFSEDTLNGIQKGKSLHAGQIVQCICASDIPRPPAPFPVGDFQGIMGAGGVGISADVHQLLRLKAPQVSQQIHFTGGGYLTFGHIGHEVRLLSGIRKAQAFLPAL